MALGKWFTAEAWSEVRSQLVTAGVVGISPYVGAAVTLFTGYLDPVVPLPWLMAAAALTFMALGLGMVAFEKSMFDRNPEGKLRIAGAILGKHYIGKKLAMVKYAIQHTNIATFPIEFEIIPLRVSLGGSINPKPDRPVTGGISQIGAVGMWWEAGVPVQSSMKGQLVEGHFDVEIRYGRPKKLKYRVTKKYLVSIRFNQVGEVESCDSSEMM
jgi:hypothetical protein